MNLVAGVGVAKVVLSCVTKAAKPLNDCMAAVVVPLMAPCPTENTGANSGRPCFGSAAATAGTIVGDALRVLMSILSAPMRIEPEPKAALARSMVRPLDVNVENGAAVPVPDQVTTKVAETVGSAFTAVALKSGGAEPKGLLKPSAHNGSPAAAAGSVSAPVFTT